MRAISITFVAMLIVAAIATVCIAQSKGALRSATFSARLTWKASTTPKTTVNVFRSSHGCSGPFTKIASGVAAGGPYVDKRLTTGTIYGYYLTASLGNQQSIPTPCVPAR